MATVKIKRKQTTTTSCFADRVSAVRRRLRGWGCQALLICNPRDIRYLTGFVGDDSWAVVWLRRPKVTVITDFRFQEQIQREAPQVSVVMRQAGLTEALEGVFRRGRVQRLALQSAHVTLTWRQKLAKKLGARRLVAVEDGLREQRAVKDVAEIASIKKALKIQQEAFRQTVAQIRPGQTEMQIAAYLEYQMRLLGADGASFPTIVAADANASLPHAIPGKRKVKKGGMILIDWGAQWGGYCSDLTRVVAIGTMPKKIQEIYEIVYEAQQSAIEVIKPGVALKDVDAAARRVIVKAGFGKYFGHSLGHGLGLDIHELPTLSGRSSGCLEPGHVVTVEPGIYLPGIGGVRIEDDVLVTPHGRLRGRRVLSDLPATIGSTII